MIIKPKRVSVSSKPEKKNFHTPGGAMPTGSVTLYKFLRCAHPDFWNAQRDNDFQFYVTVLDESCAIMIIYSLTAIDFHISHRIFWKKKLFSQHCGTAAQRTPDELMWNILISPISSSDLRGWKKKCFSVTDARRKKKLHRHLSLRGNWE